MSLLFTVAFSALLSAQNPQIPASLKAKIDATVAKKNSAEISKYMDETLKSNPKHYEALVQYWMAKIEEKKQSEIKKVPLGNPAQVAAVLKQDRLREAVGIAVESNPLVKKADADLKATEQNENQAIAKFLPDVSADVEYGRQRNAQGGDKWQNGDLNNRGVNLSQPLFHGGRNLAGYEKASLQIKNAELEKERVTQRISLEAAVSYINLVSDWQLYQLANSNEDFLSKNMEITQDRFDLGEVSNTDLAQSKTRLALAKAGKLKARNQYMESKAVFEKTTGSMEFVAENLDANMPLPANMPQNLDEAVSLALASNIEIKQSENEFAIAEEEVDMNFADALPSLDLQASMRREEESGLLLQEYDSDRVMLKLSVPIFKGGENVSKISQAKRLVSSKDYELRDKKNSVQQEMKSLWDIYSTSTETIDASQIAYEASLVSLEGVRREEELGLRTVQDVLDAEEERITAQSNLITSKREQLRNAYQILNLINRPLI